MTYDELYKMTLRMEKYGGAFVQALANAFKYADSTNREKLLNTFPDYVNEYGPNSPFALQSQ